MKNEKGITLVALGITIIVLSILAAVSISTGKKTIEENKVIAFINELKIVQSEVNIIVEKQKMGNTSYDSIGTKISDLDTGTLAKLTSGCFKGKTAEEMAEFKYYKVSDLKRMGIDNVEQEVVINLKTREVLSVEGIKDSGKMCYKLGDFASESYNVAEIIQEKDEVGTDPKNPDKPDGVPDKYQVEVFFQGVNCTPAWERTYVTLKDKEGNYDENGEGYLTEEQIPEVVADPEYENIKWDIIPSISNPIKRDITFTATAVAIPTSNELEISVSNLQKMNIIIIWEGDNLNNRPAEIVVNVYKDEKKYDTLNLSEVNNWRYSYYNLGSGKYTIKVTKPYGYDGTIEDIGSGVGITFTLKKDM